MASPVIGRTGKRKGGVRHSRGRVRGGDFHAPIFVASIRLNPSRVIDTRSGDRIRGSRRSRFRGQRRASRLNR